MSHSKNALCQAIKIVNPSVTKKALFGFINVPACCLASARYWEESYNIKPWCNRTPEEQKSALAAARKIIKA